MDAVVACDEKGGIAIRGKLPWHLPEDLKFFRDITADKVMIMGRKTYDAMPKRLCHERTSIVFSRRGLNDDQVHVVDGMEACLDVVGQYPGKEACVIGGQDIFTLFLDQGLIDQVYLTRVKGVFPADRFFPLEKVNGWNEILLLQREDFLTDLTHGGGFRCVSEGAEIQRSRRVKLQGV